jgi:hypothetical protein
MNEILEIEFDEMDLRKIEEFRRTELGPDEATWPSYSQTVRAIVRRYFLMSQQRSEAAVDLNRWAEEVPDVSLWMRIKISLHIDNLHIRCSQCHKWMLQNDYFCSDKCFNEWVPF